MAPSNIIAIHGSGITHTAWDEHETDTKPNPSENNSFSEDVSTDNSIAISDPLVLNRWKNAVKIGASIISSGKPLESSPSFQTAFKLLIKSLKSSVNNEPILQKMNECDSIDTLLAFLKNSISFKYFYKEKVFQTAYLDAHKKIKILYYILFGLSIIFIFL